MNKHPQHLEEEALPQRSCERRPTRFLSLLIFVLTVFSSLPLAAQMRVDAGTVEELRSALAQAVPGSHIMLADGHYDLAGDIHISAKGTAGKPIRIAARHRGKAVIAGASHFILTASEHLTIEGLNFQSTNGPAIELRGCSDVRISRNTFRLKETQRGLWIYINGIPGDSVRLSHHNRVDHNTFERKSMLGNFITVEGTMRAQPQISQYDRIDHNLFADIGPRVENVLEAIRFGSAEYSLSSSFGVVEENLFERCDGDPEYISIKCSDAVIRNNTFRECLGSLSLRHGNRNIVEGNFILGNGRTAVFLDSTGKRWTIGTGGVRFYGNGMRILNNYCEGLTGKRWDATFAITNGNAEYGDGRPLTKHFRIHDAVIAGNVLVNNVSNVEIGYDGGGFQGNWWTLPPMGLQIRDNIIVGSTDTLINVFSAPVNPVWERNTAWAAGKAIVSREPIDGVQVKDPRLTNDGGVWHPADKPLRSWPLTKKDVGPGAE